MFMLTVNCLFYFFVLFNTCITEHKLLIKYQSAASAVLFFSLPQRGRGTACYNIKCNTRKKYRQYSYQGVKCSYHTTFSNGGKNIVLHTFYTIRTILSTRIFKRRKKFSRNCEIDGKKPLNNQSRD